MILQKIYEELMAMRKELQTIRNSLEPGSLKTFEESYFGETTPAETAKAIRGIALSKEETT